MLLPRTIKVLVFALIILYVNCNRVEITIGSLKNPKTVSQTNPNNYSATYGYYGPAALSGYFEVYLYPSDRQITRSDLVLRVQGVIKKVYWKSNDTLCIESEGYFKDFKNREGFPVIIQMKHIESRL